MAADYAAISFVPCQVIRIGLFGFGTLRIRMSFFVALRTIARARSKARLGLCSSFFVRTSSNENSIQARRRVPRS